MVNHLLVLHSAIPVRSGSSVLNYLLTYVVSDNMVSPFKSRLEKLWYNQAIIYDFREKFKEPKVEVKWQFNKLSCASFH